MGRRYFAYIIRCGTGQLYTGYTNDLDKRLLQHNLGKGARFTRGRGPVELVYFEEFDSKGEAMTREAAIKRLTREQKLEMIAVMENDRKQ